MPLRCPLYPLQVLLKDYATTLASGPNLVVVAAGTQQVTLPWFKHFYGQVRRGSFG